ncbi:hypothetical protein [Lactobacillus iners]|jgi:putative membrane protein|uniref:hypothetical protein n=1 Tax=Lactobacillus iners TaxID=147802 RepID=UPI0001E5DCC7|nr:hypothetical protein [Lactobacillus iners]EFO67726.1 hypothetical protein HMPREF9213_1305 [Lactobacillus iners LactinV 09V1-c]EFO71500.1 hypothetical protein HMPREF9215_1225 [Lactobacillus iners SPIN 2503V10-D]EFQ47358.1 hypothetical protein HMPREF9216_0079 [Lactobacillus iners LEAF 2053A-b]EGC81184.1 conserved domain protein [Lactobacillus iners UPII 60-B]EGG33003.1 hypothetical protein HMPREF9210_0377 [Lactobacillus iners SPIN 1401G]
MFNKLFFYLFKQKAKTVLYCLLLNIICTVVIALTATHKIDYLIIVFISTSFFMNLGFLVNCSVTASKFLKKQTYRLLPMKDGYLYLANTASDFLNGLLLIAIESIIGILIVHFISFNFSKVLIGSFKLSVNTMSIVLTTISILLLSSFMLYCMLITCLLLTKICMDFLPIVLQNIRKFISVIIYIIMLLVFSRIIEYFKSLLYNESNQSTLVFFYIIGIIIIIGINYFIFNKYHEADVNN